MLKNDKKNILIFSDWFYPGYKAGGPIQSCRNIVNLLEDDLDIYIFTSDRDIGDTSSYKGIKTDQWISFNSHVHIFYASPAYCSIQNIRKAIFHVHPTAVYLNSMFSIDYAIKPLLALKTSRKDFKIVLAPRGMLHKGAMRLKAVKKKFFLKVIQSLGLANNINFHATDDQEVADIKKYFKRSAKVTLVKNIPHFNYDPPVPCSKHAGEAKFIFISRIHPKKNILFFIELISKIKTLRISLDIYGYADDEAYLNKCKKAIKNLPSNILINVHDAVSNDKIFLTMDQAHVFVLPTLGENFGHAIFESFSAGRPVLISDQTPWRNLVQQKTGWDIPLNNSKEFIKAVETIAAWDQKEFNEWCNCAYKYARNFINELDLKQQYIDLFT